MKDDANTDSKQETGYSEASFGETGIEQHQNQTHQSSPSDPYSPENLQKRERKFLDYMRTGWAQAQFHERVNILLTACIAFFTMVYVAATLVYVFVTVLTLRQIKNSSDAASRQTADLIIAAQTQAKAAERMAGASEKFSSSADSINQQTMAAVRELRRQADLANDSLKTTQESFRRDQRAWVGAIEVSPPGLSEGGKSYYLKEGTRPTFGVVILNSGKTPALHMQAMVATSAYPASTEFVPKYKSSTPPSISVLQPGQRMTITTLPGIADMTKAEIDLARTGAWIIYIHGIISYDDAFSRSHKSTFCMYIDRDLATMSSCHSYNEAD